MKQRVGKVRWKQLLLGGLLTTAVITAICMTVGAANITFLETISIVLAKFPGLTWIDFRDYPASHEMIIWQLRMPRVLLALLVGAALATVGGAFQGLFKNPMADPYIIGISSGASLGATVAIAFQLTVLLGFATVPLAAFAGALASALIVYNLGKVGTGVPVYTLLLGGVALGAFFSALSSFIIVFHSKEIHKIVFWMMGGFSGSQWFYVKVAAPLILAGIILLCCFARELNAMLFGEETARSLGIELEKTKKIILVLAAMTTAVAVAVSGTIGFVGLIIPHITRLLVGPDHRVLLPFSAIGGGVFMMLADTVARTLFAPAEIPVGVITALFGGPFFIYLLKRKKDEVFSL